MWGGLRSVPTQVPALTDVQASYNSLVGLLVTKKDLSVWKLDTHPTTLMMTATSVEELKNVVGIFPAGNRTIAVNAEGAVFSSILSSDGITSSDFTLVSGIDNVAQEVTTIPNPAKPGNMMNSVDKKISIVRSDANKPALTISINAVTGETAVNNKVVNLPTLPFIVNGSMYLPLRFISEKMGATVEWLPQEELISITMK